MYHTYKCCFLWHVTGVPVFPVAADKLHETEELVGTESVVECQCCWDWRRAAAVQ